MILSIRNVCRHPLHSLISFLWWLKTKLLSTQQAPTFPGTTKKETANCHSKLDDGLGQGLSLSIQSHILLGCIASKEWSWFSFNWKWLHKTFLMNWFDGQRTRDSRVSSQFNWKWIITSPPQAVRSMQSMLRSEAGRKEEERELHLEYYLQPDD